MIPTYIVIPIKSGERQEMTARLVEQLGDCPIRLDDSERTITEKWNDGLAWAAELAGGKPHNVLLLNNDVEVCPNFVSLLARGLRQNDSGWIAYPNYVNAPILSWLVVECENDAFANQTISGWAFMLRGEAGLRFDEQFRWWYADSDIEKQVRAAGKKAVMVGGCYAKHLDPMRSTMRPDLLALAQEDERRFAAKWSIAPETLWLAENPQFGKIPLTNPAEMVH